MSFEPGYFASVLIVFALTSFVATSLPATILGGVPVGLMASDLYSGKRTMVTA